VSPIDLLVVDLLVGREITSDPDHALLAHSEPKVREIAESLRDFFLAFITNGHRKRRALQAAAR
jgi:hypothetical protein